MNRPTALLEAHELVRRLPPERRGAAERVAVDRLSLELHAGDVLGLLGLNGAGKSTTLRMLSGCLVPDEGSVRVAGHSLDDEPLAARAALGYLADQPPLFDDMRVQDYLAFTARLRRLPRTDIDRSVALVIEECKLESVGRRRIGTLSKGFRQRVGIAQAIVHAPDVVLLDEPSNGLDPQQMQEMRALLARLGERRAVLVSSHLLGEVQDSCTRVAMLHHGRLIGEHDMASLAADGRSLADAFGAAIERADMARSQAQAQTRSQTQAPVRAAA